jgi:hypothetical protein
MQFWMPYTCPTIQQPMSTMECISRTVRPEELFLFQSKTKERQDCPKTPITQVEMSCLFPPRLVAASTNPNSINLWER